MPFFDYHGLMRYMAAFKEHATFGFWKGTLIPGLAAISTHGGESMGNLGRLASMKDLPTKKVLAGYLKAAMRLNEDGATTTKPKKATKPESKVPPDLAAALEGCGGRGTGGETHDAARDSQSIG